MGSNRHLLLTLSLLLCIVASTYACKGCLSLDEYNFNKIITRFKAVLVKFDIAYPYGDKHDVYSKLAEEFVDNKNLIFTEVGVKDYGEKDNEKLAQKYGVSNKDELPTLKLFLSGNVNEPIAYKGTGEWTVDNIRNFIKDNSNIYIGLPGCLEKMDKYAKEFMDSKDRESKLKEIEKKTKSLQESEKETANIYLKFMKKILEAGANFIKQENKRLQKIITEGKVNDKKKQTLSNNLNVLQAFSINIKDEL